MRSTKSFTYILFQMNIFYLHHNTKICAEMHVNKHCVKMIVEYAQLLCTSHRVLDKNNSDVLYKATYMNHPSAIWVRESVENYQWLFNMFCDLIIEYKYRYGKTHKSSRLIPYLKIPPKNIPMKPFTEPTPIMPKEFVVMGDSIKSYHNYYRGAKKHLHKWKNRDIPSFIEV